MIKRRRDPESGSKSEVAGGRSRLVDVARLAGVSLGSASRALTTPESVKPKTLKAVRYAVQQLSYVPHGLARSLARRRSLTAGAIVPTVSNPVYADFVHALQDKLRRCGYSLLVAAHEYNRETEVDITHRLLEQAVDGLVLVGSDHDRQVLEHIHRAKVPFVTTWSADESHGRSFVGFHNRRAMQAVAHHLIKLGHTHIAVLSGHTAFNERARARLEGIVDAMSAAGKTLPPENVFYGEFSVEAGRDGLRRAMKLRPRPTALICSTDLVAAGALAEATSTGIKVPRDLSITGFDNIVYSGLLTPRLTTVDVPTAQMGQQSGEMLVRMISGEADESLTLPAELIVRESSAPPPRRPPR